MSYATYADTAQPPNPFERAMLCVAIVVILLCLTMNSHGAAHPTVKAIYSADFCVPCHALTREVARRGSIIVQAKHERPAAGIAAYPTVLYSDGSRDNGERVYRGACVLPKRVKVYEWVTR